MDRFLGTPIGQPQYLPLSAWHEHGPFAMWLVQRARPRTIVELGSHYGYSYFCFCQAVAEAGLDSRCYAVDTWQGDEHAGAYPEDVFQQVRAENEKYANFSTLIRKTFADGLADVEDGSVDILHVDGRHYFDDVKQDYESWTQKLSDRAIVLFHDTEVYERGFGVHQYWLTLASQYPSFNFLHGHGLGVLFRGAQIVDEMHDLLRLTSSEDGLALVLGLFAALGSRVALQYQTRQTCAAVEAAHAEQIARLQSELQDARCAAEPEFRRQFDQMKTDLAAAEEERRNLRRRPLVLLRHNIAYNVLRALSTASAGVSKRAAAHFDRISLKFDPDR